MPRSKPKRLRTKLGEEIYKARRANDLTQEALAKKLHVQQITVSNWEYGRNRPARYGLAAIAKALDISVEVLQRADAADGASAEAVIPDAGHQ